MRTVKVIDARILHTLHSRTSRGPPTVSTSPSLEVSSPVFTRPGQCPPDSVGVVGDFSVSPEPQSSGLQELLEGLDETR